MRAGASESAGWLQSYRATLGVRRYEHSELDGDEVGTTFNNDSDEAEVLLSHRPLGDSWAASAAGSSTRAFEAAGAEALSPPIDQRGFAGFLYEEVKWSHATLQFGGRLDRAQLRAAGRTAGSRLHRVVGFARPAASSPKRPTTTS